MPKAIVIGGGFGGIAAALRMRAKGYDVTLIDKQDKLGGRGYQYTKETEHGTFIHDAGPTVITAKFLFDELFELFGKKREDYVEFRDIYPWYRIVFAGSVTRPEKRGHSYFPPDAAAQAENANAENRNVPFSPASGDLPSFDYGGTLEEFEAQIRKFGGERDVRGFRKYLKHSKKIFDKGFTDLGDQPFDKFTTMLRCGPDLIKLGAWRTVWQMSGKYIKHPLLRRVFSFQPLLVGGNPFNTTSIYSLIFYLEREWGVQFAMGGTGAIVRGLQKLMEEEGIELRLGEEVTRIEVGDETTQEWIDESKSGRYHLQNQGRTVDAIFLNGREESADIDALLLEGVAGEPDVLLADAVVINGDPPHVYRKLIRPVVRPTWTDAKIDALKYSMGLFVFYFGTTRQYPDVAHHTIVLGEAYKELLEKLFDKHELERHDLSVYLHRPTATDESMAPAGMDSFYVLVPVPNLQPMHRSREKGVGSLFRREDSPEIETSDTKKTPDPFFSTRDVPVTNDGTIDWDKFGDAFRDDVVRYLERTVLPGLSDTITGDFYVTPNHFRDNLNTHFGTGFSVQPIFRQSAWFRFHNKSDIDGLYFVGAGTHPGAGMPGVLCSAKVVDNLIPAVNATARPANG